MTSHRHPSRDLSMKYRFRFHGYWETIWNMQTSHCWPDIWSTKNKRSKAQVWALVILSGWYSWPLLRTPLAQMWTTISHNFLPNVKSIWGAFFWWSPEAERLQHRNEDQARNRSAGPGNYRKDGHFASGTGLFPRRCFRQSMLGRFLLFLTKPLR